MDKKRVKHALSAILFISQLFDNQKRKQSFRFIALFFMGYGDFVFGENVFSQNRKRVLEKPHFLLLAYRRGLVLKVRRRHSNAKSAAIPHGITTDTSFTQIREYTRK